MLFDVKTEIMVWRCRLALIFDGVELAFQRMFPLFFKMLHHLAMGLDDDLSVRDDRTINGRRCRP
jgi:hypothetical protein